MVEYALRPAAPDDAEFLYRVYASTREEELAVVPWSPEQKAAFLRMQFKAQATDYHAKNPAARFLIIESAGRPVGRLYLDRSGAEERIIDIALLPDARGAGLGRAILETLLGEAAAAGKAVTIHVEKMNRALRLYERLGFQPVEDQGVYLYLRWSPPETVR
jgi:ribosomal protein S18 acetylase RimI-like enzyme